MALRWDGNQRQAKMLAARFRCVFWDNGWFGASGTRVSQTLLKTQERVKTHTGAILVCLLVAVFLPLLPDRAHSPELLFSCSNPRLLRFRKYEKNLFQRSLTGNSCVIHLAA